MKRFKKILYYTDASAGSSAALERAAELAVLNRGQLTVLRVLEHLPRDLQMLVTCAPLDDLLDAATRDLRERMAEFVKPVRQRGLRLGIEVLIGKPFIEIIRHVLGHGYDLVMMSAEGRKGGLTGLLFGSTRLHLMRKCPCPVWVIKFGPHRRFKRILAAVNPDPYDEGHQGVNTKIMELAASLARLEGSELRVVHAWNVQAEYLVHGRLPAADVDRIMRDTGATHELWMKGLLAKHPLTDIPHNVHLFKGEPAEVITSLAAKKRVDLIVMGTVGRTGIPGFFIGNTAEAVLSQVNCSVLAVKPDGFVTPVRVEPLDGSPS